MKKKNNANSSDNPLNHYGIIPVFMTQAISQPKKYSKGRVTIVDDDNVTNARTFVNENQK